MTKSEQLRSLTPSQTRHVQGGEPSPVPWRGAPPRSPIVIGSSPIAINQPMPW